MLEEQDVMDKFYELRNNFTVDQLIEIDNVVDFYYETFNEYINMMLHLGNTNILPEQTNQLNEVLVEIDNLMNLYL